MKNIENCLTIDDIEELKRQIQCRKKVMLELVGQLYPSILSDEIEKIENHINFLKTGKCQKCNKEKCICDLLNIDKKIQEKENQISNLMNERGRLARERDLEGDTIPEKSITVKMLRLTKAWSREEHKIRRNLKNNNKIRLAIANTLYICREEVLKEIGI